MLVVLLVEFVVDLEAVRFVRVVLTVVVVVWSLYVFFVFVFSCLWRLC